MFVGGGGGDGFADAMFAAPMTHNSVVKIKARIDSVFMLFLSVRVS
jgi:hypothetical protein